jgi:hypothetical protein
MRELRHPTSRREWNDEEEIDPLGGETLGVAATARNFLGRRVWRRLVRIRRMPEAFAG